MSNDDYNKRMNAQAHAAWNAQISSINRSIPRGSMPKVSDMIFSKYISKTDVQAPVVCTIRGVMLDNGGGRNEEPRWLMAFNELRKMLRLNNTTLRQLEAALGDDSNAWVGARVRLYVDPNVMMAGQVVGGVRMQIAKRKAPPAGAGWPGTGQASSQAPRFDPMTGQPLAAAPIAPQTQPTPAPQPQAQRQPEFEEGETHPQDTHPNAPGNYEFDDDIPF